MSFLTSIRANTVPRLTLLRQAYSAATSTNPSSAFHTSSTNLGLKESDQGRENMDQVYEAEKHNQLKSRREGKAKWSGDLASNSEASVKADRGEVDSDKDFNELQNRTKHDANKK